MYAHWPVEKKHAAPCKHLADRWDRGSDWEQPAPNGKKDWIIVNISLYENKYRHCINKIYRCNMGKNWLNLMTIRETEEVTERGQEDKEVKGKLLHLICSDALSVSDCPPQRVWKYN